MEPTRHEALWLSTGDVVLSTNTYLFKVHKEILALQSSVFRDMFEFPTGTVDISVEDARPVGHENGSGSAPDRYEGLPLVALSGDEGKDVAHLLKAVYYREYYDRDNDETPLETIIALLVLGNKYDFKHICKEVTKQLSRHYPNTLAGFDVISGYRRHLFGTWRDMCHVRLLEACHTANVAVLLPSIYYAFAEYSVGWMNEQVDEAGGLRAECLRTALSGKCKLEFACATFIASLPDEFRTISCSSCKVGAYISQLHQQLEDKTSHLSSYHGEDLTPAVLVNGCQTCSARLTDRINEKREELWDEIPSCFGFTGWDGVKKEQDPWY